MFVPNRSRIATALLSALAAVAVIAVGSLSASSAAPPVASTSKALGTKHLTIRKAGVMVPAGGFRNANYNSATVAVKCGRGEVALSASTAFPTQPDNTEVVTRYARLTVNARGKPNGAVASGATDLATAVPFEVHALCAR